MSNPAIYLPPKMLQEMKFPGSLRRLKMLNRLKNTHYRIEKYHEVEATTLEDLDGLAGIVVSIRNDGWLFEGLCGNDERGAYLSFYRMIPWTPEEIQEAKDWLEANPLIIKEDKSEST